VSKDWSALISDLTFVEAHKSRHAEPLIVVSYSQGNSRICCGLRLMDMDGNLVRVIKGTSASRLISTSADDLLCVTNDPYGGAHVIDPASGKFLLDYQHLTVFCFGRALPSGAFKVLSISYGLMVCEVLTLGGDTTSRRSRLPPTIVDSTGSSPVVVNGVMYFSATSCMYDYTLHRFDLESEEWKTTIEGPEITVGHDVLNMTTRIIMAELNGALCIAQSEIDLTRTTNNEHVNIWILTDPAKERWIKEYTIPMAASTYNYRPLRLTHDGGKLIFHCTNREGGELQVYNPQTQTITSLWKLDEITENIGLCNLNLDRFV
jgi:F-box interacting protein